MSEKKLSIITPFHNQDFEVFKRTADSVYEAAKNISFEWVIIMHNTDSCTKDELLDLLGNDENTCIYELRNDWHSPSSPRNEGILKSSGKYLYFLDDDDVCEKDFFEKAIDKMERDDCDILIGRAECIREKEDIFMVPMPLLFPESEDGYIVPDDPDIKGNLLYGACAFLGTKLILSDIVKKNHIEFDKDITLSEDILFELRCYAHAEKICIMSDLTGYTYIQRENSLLQKMMHNDSFDESVYIEPLERIVNEGLASGISPSAHVWNMMGMFGVIYAGGAMDKEKKNRLFSLSHKYIPTLNFDFPKQISDKRIRKEYILKGCLQEDEMKRRLKALFPDKEISLYHKSIAKLDEKKQIAFMKGFWRILEEGDDPVSVAMFETGENETRIMLGMERALFEDKGAKKVRKCLCYGD